MRKKLVWVLVKDITVCSFVLLNGWLIYIILKSHWSNIEWQLCSILFADTVTNLKICTHVDNVFCKELELRIYSTQTADELQNMTNEFNFFTIAWLQWKCRWGRKDLTKANLIKCLEEISSEKICMFWRFPSPNFIRVV